MLFITNTADTRRHYSPRFIASLLSLLAPGITYLLSFYSFVFFISVRTPLANGSTFIDLLAMLHKEIVVS